VLCAPVCDGSVSELVNARTIYRASFRIANSGGDPVPGFDVPGRSGLVQVFVQVFVALIVQVLVLVIIGW
jgi:hypothetical protein